MESIPMNDRIRLNYLLKREDPLAFYLSLPNYTSLSIFLYIKMSEMFVRFSLIDMEDKVFLICNKNRIVNAKITKTMNACECSSLDSRIKYRRVKDISLNIHLPIPYNEVIKAKWKLLEGGLYRVGSS